MDDRAAAPFADPRMLLRVEMVDRLTRALATREDVVAAWLFGSRARSTSSATSDVDVAVLLRDDPKPGLESYRFDLAADLTEQVGASIDLVVANRISADLMHRVLRDGVVLVDRDRARRIAFEVRKRAEYLDMAPVWRAYRRQPVRR